MGSGFARLPADSKYEAHTGNCPCSKRETNAPTDEGKTKAKQASDGTNQLFVASYSQGLSVPPFIFNSIITVRLGASEHRWNGYLAAVRQLCRQSAVRSLIHRARRREQMIGRAISVHNGAKISTLTSKRLAETFLKPQLGLRRSSRGPQRRCGATNTGVHRKFRSGTRKNDDC